MPTEDDKKLWVFVPELCRSIWLEAYNGGDDEVQGIPVQQFRPGKDVFDMSNEDNFCYCPAFEECAYKAANNTYDPEPCQTEKYNCINGLIQVNENHKFNRDYYLPIIIFFSATTACNFKMLKIVVMNFHWCTSKVPVGQNNPIIELPRTVRGLEDSRKC